MKYGYYKNSAGQVIDKIGFGDKVTLPNYPGCDFFEVGTQLELDAIKIYIDPIDPVKLENNRKIQAETRLLAIESLIAKGELPPDYTDEW